MTKEAAVSIRSGGVSEAVLSSEAVERSGGFAL